MRTIARRLASVLVLLAGLSGAHAQPLPKLNADLHETSVSGLSSGAFMAVQFEIAYSAIVKGAGIIAGGPYGCAHGDIAVALSVCTCSLTMGFFCPLAGAIDVRALVQATRRNARNHGIDPVARLEQHRVWLFHGLLDTLVPTSVMDALQAYYTELVAPDNVRYWRDDIAAGHAWPTDLPADQATRCGASPESPFIAACSFDAAGEVLRWIYGPHLNARNDGALTGALATFDQSEFLAHPANHGMHATGFVYIPKNCTPRHACRVHVALHGCLQGAAFVGDTFARKVGYNRWADTNDIIVLYPQAAPRPSTVLQRHNPEGCWDWWGYDDPASHLKKRGRQLAAINAMVRRLASRP